jgi:tyrosyl-tRNA synthetase
MGKSEGNSVCLDPELTPPYDFYQYWINVDDADVERLLRLYTFLPESRIEELTRAEGVGLREAKQTLAREVTTLTHGEAAAIAAEAAARALFDGAPDVDDPNIPTTEIAASDVAAMSLADLFIRAGLVPSRGEARRKAAEGALWIDGERLEDVDAPFQPTGNDTLLRFGKKRYRRIRIVP